MTWERRGQALSKYKSIGSKGRGRRKKSKFCLNKQALSVIQVISNDLLKLKTQKKNEAQVMVQFKVAVWYKPYQFMFLNRIDDTLLLSKSDLLKKKIT